LCRRRISPRNGRRWIIDPIDGTVNFVHGFPLCAVSLSLCDANAVVAAVIDLPFLGSQYTALLGQGAYADGKQLHVSETSTLADALISIDQYAFGEDAERKNRLRLRLTERLAPNRKTSRQPFGRLLALPSHLSVPTQAAVGKRPAALCLPAPAAPHHADVRIPSLKGLTEDVFLG
jgi:hypothetical protein